MRDGRIAPFVLLNAAACFCRRSNPTITPGPHKIMEIHLKPHRRLSRFQMLALCLVLVSVPVAAQFAGPPQDLPANQRGEPRDFGKTIVLNDDDKPAFPQPPDGWDAKREGVPHGKLEM